MPRVDGFQVLKWIKAQPHLLRAIVVVLTGVSDLKTIQQAYNLGAHSFLSKDANEAELRNVATFLKDYARISSVLPEPPKSDGSHKAA